MISGWPPFGLEIAGVPQHPLEMAPQSSGGSWSSLKDIIGKGILWAAVPKHRRSLERRMMRRMGSTKRVKYLTPKKNIIECLVCGHWHEAHTICGKMTSRIYL